MIRESTVAASLAIDLVGHLVGRGIAEVEICRQAGLAPEALRAPDERLPGSVMERLWAAGERLAGDPDLGLHAAEAYSPGALSIFGYVLLNCATASDLAVQLGRYAAILHDGLRVTLTRDADTTTCRFDAVLDRDNFLVRSPRQPMETLAAGVVGTLNALTKTRVAPLEVTFRHAAPPSTIEHLRLLGVAPRFSSEADGVVYRTADLDRPVRSANAALLSTFVQQADDALTRLEEHGPVSRRILHALAERLRGGAPALDQVAKSLGMSPRSLQRALRDEHTSYQALLDVARRDLAIRHLGAPEGSAAEVAFLLGFADASAFTRSFRRWTGSTPGAWRSRHRAGAARAPSPRVS